MRTEQFHNDIASQNGLLSDENEQLKRENERLKQEIERLKRKEDELESDVLYWIRQNGQLRQLQGKMLDTRHMIKGADDLTLCRWIRRSFRTAQIPAEAPSGVGPAVHPPGGEGPAPTAMESD